MLTKRAERCAVARRGPGGGHAAQHLSNIEMASRRLLPALRFDVTGTCARKKQPQKAGTEPYFSIPYFSSVGEMPKAAEKEKFATTVRSSITSRRLAPVRDDPSDVDRGPTAISTTS